LPQVLPIGELIKQLNQIEMSTPALSAGNENFSPQPAVGAPGVTPPSATPGAAEVPVDLVGFAKDNGVYEFLRYDPHTGKIFLGQFEVPNVLVVDGKAYAPPSRLYDILEKVRRQLK